MCVARHHHRRHHQQQNGTADHGTSNGTTENGKAENGTTENGTVENGQNGVHETSATESLNGEAEHKKEVIANRPPSEMCISGY